MTPGPIPSGGQLRVVLGVSRARVLPLRLAYEGQDHVRVVASCAAAADALGVKDISLPLTPRRLHGLIAGAEPPRPAGARAVRLELHAETAREGRPLRGAGPET